MTISLGDDLDLPLAIAVMTINRVEKLLCDGILILVP